MIKDREIDLTVNGKFSGRTVQEKFDRKVQRCMEKLGIVKIRSLMDTYDMPVQMPWESREIHSINQTRISRVDDKLSHETGLPIRVCSNNEIIVLNNLNCDKEFLEMVLLETVGLIPYTSWNRCFRCGEYTLTPHKHLVFLCENCVREEQSIPWERRQR